jgi:hypothetical protein
LPRASIERLWADSLADSDLARSTTLGSTPSGHFLKAEPHLVAAHEHSTRILPAIDDPLLAVAPSERESALDPSLGASPRQSAALRPEEKRRKSPTSAANARAASDRAHLGHTGAIIALRSDDDAATSRAFLSASSYCSLALSAHRVAASRAAFDASSPRSIPCSQDR